MREERRFHLVRFLAKCEVKQNESVSIGYLANVSFNGALIKLQENLISLIQPGDSCALTLHPGENELPFTLKAEVIHYAFSMAGVRFHAMDDAEYHQLVMLIEKVTQKPENSGRTWREHQEKEVKIGGKSQPIQLSH